MVAKIILSLADYTALWQRLWSAACPVPAIPVGVKDHFGEVGSTDFLMEKYGLKSKDIIAAAKQAIELKIIQIQKRGKQDEILFRQRQIG